MPEGITMRKNNAVHRHIIIRGSVVALVLLLGAALPAAAQQFSAAQSARILGEIDAQVSFLDSDFSGEYTIVQDKPGQGSSSTTAAVFRRDREDKMTIIILEPSEDRGKGYLQIDNNLWIYDPVSRRFNVTSARDRFQNSNARNSDFTTSTLADDYRIVSSEPQQLGAYATTVYGLQALRDDVAVPSMKIWVDENNLVRKFEDYSLSGQLLRTTAIPRYQRLGQRFVPVQIVIIDALQGRTIDGQFRNERTIIAVERPSLNPLTDLVFTQAYLERNAR
jgi:outer membrane lipoprotein-sorting protein